MKKHSITIAGHRTSFTLEDAFWQELKRIAKEMQQSIATLVAEIDAQRTPPTNLSSALRLFVLANVKAQKGLQLTETPHQEG